MNIVISTKSQKPIYEQIYNQISAQIISNELVADYMLPSIRALAKELGISIITVKSSYEMLESKGFIYTIAGKGCFVALHPISQLQDKKMTIAKEKIKSDIEYFKELGLTKSELIALIDKEY